MDKVDEYIAHVENEIYNEPIEHAYIVKPNGNVYYAVGNSGAVNITLDDFTGAIITHNHPPQHGGYVSFSKEDLAFYVRNPHIKELRAVNADFTYSMRLIEAPPMTFNDAYRNAANDIDSSFNGDFQHVIMEWLKKEGYIQYERIERKAKKD